jgi:hypothetical protein
MTPTSQTPVSRWVPAQAKSVTPKPSPSLLPSPPRNPRRPLRFLCSLPFTNPLPPQSVFIRIDPWFKNPHFLRALCVLSGKKY